MSHRLATVSRLTRGAAGTALVLAVAAAATGCGTSTGAFQDSGGRADCRIHQDSLPDKDYTGGASADTQAVLMMLHYITAHRTQAYCDGHSASKTDQAWSALYERLTGAPDQHQ